jgi:hypothetical protein
MTICRCSRPYRLPWTVKTSTTSSWSNGALTTCVRAHPWFDHVPRIPWIFSEAFDDLVARSFGIRFDTQAASAMPNDPLPFLHHPIPRRPTAATAAFSIHGRAATPPGRPNRPHPYLNVAEPDVLPLACDQDIIMDDVLFPGLVGSTLQPPWDAGPPSIVPHTYYDSQQHHDGLHAPSPGGEEQPAASSSTTLPRNHEPAIAQAVVQRPTKGRRARPSHGRRYSCDACGASLTRNWLLTRHREKNCPVLREQRGRKAPGDFDYPD